MRSNTRFLLAFLVALSLPVAAQVNKRDMDIKAGDGANLKATYYNPGQPGPGVLLLHQCNRDRKSWDTLATKLAEEGIHVLTLDYRGYGESHGGSGSGRNPNLSRTEFRKLREKWEGDIEIAYATLLSQPGVDKTRIGAGGASCGVSNSVQLARKHKEIKTLVLLSGRTDEAGLNYLRANSSLPVFGAASEEDTRSARSIRQIVDTSTHPKSKLAMYNNAGHGVPMFSAEPELLPSIVAWYKNQLQDVETARFSSFHLNGNIHVIQIHSGESVMNIAVSVGPDGVLLVNHREAEFSDKIHEELRIISEAPVKFLVNTHWHLDHVGGNARYGSDATIISSANARKKLTTRTKAWWNPEPFEPRPRRGWPAVTFDNALSLYFNGEEI